MDGLVCIDNVIGKHNNWTTMPSLSIYKLVYSIKLIFLKIKLIPLF